MELSRRLASSEDGVYDVVILGGGILGAGIARELSLRGLKVAVFEKGDFGSGTSSASSKLVHGGLRYLESGEFRLVFEACRERRFLLENAPHLVKPLPFLLPIYQGSRFSLWKVFLGMLAYDLLSAFRNVRPHQMISAKRALGLQKGLKRKGLRGAARYFDAQMDDARLCLEAILQARDWGADVFNYASVTSIQKEVQQVQSISVQDLLTGEMFGVRSRMFVSTLGPWTDQVLGTSFLRLSRGAHLVTRKFSVAQGLLCVAKEDSRVFFVLPYGTATLIGTTDLEFSGNPDEVVVSPEEMAYLLRAANDTFPDVQLTEKDILYKFSGVRPLVKSDVKSIGKTSREHQCEWIASNLLAVFGGKYTTFRSISESSAELVWRKLGEPGKWKSLTRHIAFPGAVAVAPKWQAKLRSMHYRRLSKRYGSLALRIIDLVDSHPEYGIYLPDSEILVAEVYYAITYEMAYKPTDFVRRRTPVGLTGHCTHAFISKIIAIYGQVFSWSEQVIESELRSLSRAVGG